MTADALPLIDPARYPLHELSSSDGQKLVDSTRQEFEENGLVVLDGFLRPEAAERIVTQAFADARTGGHRFAGSSDVFFKSEADIDRQTGLTYTKTDVPYDRIGPDSPVLTLFHWEPLLAFISAVAGRQAYRSADPLGAVVVQIQGDGDQQDWHFDISEYTILMHAQAPQSGGVLQYVTRSREQMLQDPGMLDSIKAGDPSIVIRDLPTVPGTIVLHAGSISMHRVTPSAGPVPRVNATLTFNSRPGVTLNEYTRMLHFGRNS